MDNLDYSEEEILEQLALLGHKNIPRHRILKYKQDLDQLIRLGQRENLVPTAQTATPQPSPPAYIKEKVNPSYSEGAGIGFFLHAEKTNHDRKLFTTCESRNHGCQQRGFDSYIQHSVAPKRQLPPGAPNRLQVEPDAEDTLESLSDRSSSSSSSSDSQQRCFIKRKVLRKHEGKSLICDESVYSEGSAAASCLEEQMADLDLATAQKDLEAEHEGVPDESQTQSSEDEDISLSTFESYIGAMTRSQRPKPKSFIRPVISQQNIKKTDPVARYHQYKQVWEMFKLPGERDRKALHWEIKEKLAYQPPPPKPRRVFVPNTYVVPTEKKRSALRWEIRNDLANGFLPQRFHYQF